jgi:hypothetical protein
MLGFLGHNAALFRVLAAMRLDKLVNLVRMKPYGTTKRIGGQLAALGELIDINDAAAQDFRHILGSDQ